MTGPNYQGYFDNWAKCPKCRSDDIDADDYEPTDRAEVLCPVACNNCGFTWNDVFVLHQITTESGKVLAERGIKDEDLVSIMELANEGLSRAETRGCLLERLDITDEEADRLRRILEKRLNPHPKVCTMCGERATTDDFCDLCAKLFTNIAGEALKEFNEALNAGPHDGAEERLILEAFALRMAREIKKRITEDGVRDPGSDEQGKAEKTFQQGEEGGEEG